ncbi:MAG: hypothetical protein JW983_02170, partial [Elusimicrobia bacterium]|nr:hypothetical protein [Elusimicrobiota bacterium]
MKIRNILFPICLIYLLSHIYLYAEDDFIIIQPEPDPIIDIPSDQPDTTPPTGSIVINNGNPEITYSENVILYLTCNDEGSGVDKVRYSNDAVTWTPWEVPVSTKEWTLTSENGTKTVYYEIKDAAGNTTQLNDTINLGITFPTGSIVINSDNPDYSHSENAILYLTYNDEGSGVDKVR